jgi:1-acyl-sn-glycerol-3-phosphate acyltransferase
LVLLRSFLFNVVMLLSAAVYAPLMLPTVVLPFALRYRLISAWARFQLIVLKHLCRLDYRVEGREHLPGGSAIILSKHQSAWETIAFQGIFPPQTWVLKRELLWIPLFGWAALFGQCDRGARAEASGRLSNGARTCDPASGWWCFPRYARSAGTRYAMGGAVLAAETGYPVVPVAHNAGSFWLRRGFLKRPGTVRVVIGPVIDPRGQTAEAIIKQAEEWIEKKMVELEKTA